MDQETKQLVEEVEAIAVPEVIGQGDGPSWATARIKDLCSVVRQQDQRITELEAELRERMDAAAAWDALSVARFREIEAKTEMIQRLEANLTDAMDLAEEAIPYVADYYCEKYGFDERLAKLLPSQGKNEPDENDDVGGTE